jgi:GntR family transcriptional regulator
MWFHIDPSTGVPIYLQLVNQVKQAAASGVLSPGDQLPPVRKLAVDLTTNPNTVAKAYQELEREGVVATSQGRGTFIAEKGITLLKKERVRILKETIDSTLAKALNLGFTEEELLALVEEQAKEWFRK